MKKNTNLRKNTQEVSMIKNKIVIAHHTSTKINPSIQNIKTHLQDQVVITLAMKSKAPTMKPKQLIMKSKTSMIYLKIRVMKI